MLTVCAGFLVLMLVGCEGCLGAMLGRARAVWRLGFLVRMSQVLYANVLGFVNVVNASFYRQRESAYLIGEGKNLLIGF